MNISPVETIFSFLDGRSLALYKQCSHGFKEAIDKANIAWKYVFFREYPDFPLVHEPREWQLFYIRQYLLTHNNNHAHIFNRGVYKGISLEVTKRFRLSAPPVSYSTHIHALSITDIFLYQHCHLPRVHLVLDNTSNSRVVVPFKPAMPLRHFYQLGNRLITLFREGSLYKCAITNNKIHQIFSVHPLGKIVNGCVFFSNVLYAGYKEKIDSPICLKMINLSDGNLIGIWECHANTTAALVADGYISEWQSSAVSHTVDLRSRAFSWKKASMCPLV